MYQSSIKVYQMSYFHKFVEFSWSYVYYIAKNYLPLLQQIADSLKKTGLVGTLAHCVLYVACEVLHNYNSELITTQQSPTQDLAANAS